MFIRNQKFKGVVLVLRLFFLVQSNPESYHKEAIVPVLLRFTVRMLSSWSKNSNHLFPDTPSKMSFEYLVKGVLMPSVSLFGLAGNFLSIYILHHREVKLKKDFVDVLCMLATFDNLLLLTTFFLFSLPTISSTWHAQVSKVI